MLAVCSLSRQTIGRCQLIELNLRQVLTECSGSVQVCKGIHDGCFQQDEAKGFFRVVIEKPFGKVCALRLLPLHDPLGLRALGCQREPRSVLRERAVYAELCTGFGWSSFAPTLVRGCEFCARSQKQWLSLSGCARCAQALGAH